jgi:hypothetical protein
VSIRSAESTILVPMTSPPSATTRGILNPAGSPAGLSFDDFAAREKLRPFVARILFLRDLDAPERSRADMARAAGER